VQRFDRESPTFLLPSPQGSEPIPTVVMGRDVIGGAFQALYETDLIPYLPLAIEQAYAGNDDIVSGLAGQVSGDPSVALSGMWFSVECSDEAPFNDPAIIRANAEARPFFRDYLLSDSTPAVCEIWGVPPSAAAESLPVSSDVPALVIAGEYDPIHPPEWSELAASTLSNSLLVELPGAGHGAGFSECGLGLIAAFLDAPATALDTACVARMQGPAFVADLHLNRGVYRFADGALQNPALWPAGLFVLCTLVTLSPLIVVSVWVLRGRGSMRTAFPARTARFANLLAITAAVSCLVFLAGLGWLIYSVGTRDPYVLFFGAPRSFVPLFVFPWITALVSLPLGLLVVRGWRRRTQIAIPTLYLSILFVGLLGYISILAYWRFYG
jgi:hypothetical protein